MKQIQLTQNKVAVIDADDFDRVTKYKWHAFKTHGGYYAARNDGGVVLMHREIMICAKGEIVDHINQDRLDNRKSNLRIVTHAQNMCNRRPRIGGSSRYLGVTRREIKLKSGGNSVYWVASIGVDRRSQYIGIFKNEVDAARAYDAKAREIHGAYANPNFND